MAYGKRSNRPIRPRCLRPIHISNLNPNAPTFKPRAQKATTKNRGLTKKIWPATRTLSSNQSVLQNLVQLDLTICSKEEVSLICCHFTELTSLTLKADCLIKLDNWLTNELHRLPHLTSLSLIDINLSRYSRAICRPLPNISTLKLSSANLFDDFMRTCGITSCSCCLLGGFFEGIVFSRNLAVAFPNVSTLCLTGYARHPESVKSQMERFGRGYLKKLVTLNLVTDCELYFDEWSFHQNIIGLID